MTGRLRYVVSVVGAAALATSVMTNALASHPAPLRGDARSNVHHTTVNGALTVTDVFHANKNESVYGKLYAHGGQQVWKGLLVHNGGLTVIGGTKTDSLEVAGSLSTGSAIVSGNLQAGTLTSTGAISGSALTLTAGTSGAGTITAAGKITGNGIDAGPGGLTTAGTITAGGRIAGNGIDAGAGGLTTTGAITTGGLIATGNVDFSRATVTGLSLSSLNLQNLSIPSLNLGNPTGTTSPLSLTENGQTELLGVDSSGALTVRSEAIQGSLSAGATALGSLTLGTLSGTSPVLTLTGNNHTAQIGLDVNGNLTVPGLSSAGSITASGSLNVTGSATVGSLVLTGAQGLVSSNLQAPPTSNTNPAPGALTITGSSIALNGATTANGSLTVGGGNDLSLSTSGGSNPTSSHLLANGARDVAGQSQPISFTGPYGPSVAGAVTVSFTRNFTSLPIITITAASDPSPGSTSPPKVYVLVNGSPGAYTGFTIYYTAPSVITPPATIPPIVYDYHVIGS